jgi:hypothetical protein
LDLACASSATCPTTSAPLLFHLAAHDAQLRDVHVMLQRKSSRE